MKHICRYTSEQIRRAGMTVITAHSGCEGTPANSIEHIYTAIESGAVIASSDQALLRGRLFFVCEVEKFTGACYTYKVIG